MGTKAKKKAAAKSKPRSTASVKAKVAKAGKTKAKKAKAPTKRPAKRAAVKAKTPAKKTRATAAKKSVTKKKKAAYKTPLPEIAPAPGKDMYMIPVEGEIHPARIEEGGQIEKKVQHDQNVALQKEEQKIKSITALNKGKQRIFIRPKRT